MTTAGSPVAGSVDGGVVTWHAPGNATASWSTETALPFNGWLTPFSGTFTQQVEDGILPGSVGISGAPRVGRVLTADPGTWNPDGVTLTYQWNRSNVPIPGATSGTYTLRWRDLASRISVTVAGAKEGYAGVIVTSPLTVRIRPSF